ncbi:uncharacterized protein ACR2FA_012215 [Aphomia sociella]
MTENNVVRCEWANKNLIYIEYHDDGWGKPERDSLKLFEMLCLGGQQAGLSWITILKKRESYRKLFHNFNPYKIAKMTSNDVKKLLNNTGILRNKLKIEAIINNAKCYIVMENKNENFSEFIWSFVNNKPIVNNWHSMKDIPTENEASIALAKGLKKKGFKFVGSTICYSFMQTCGLIDDHTVDCLVKQAITMTERKKESKEKKRCQWVTNEPIYIAYHDKEWGKPEYDSLQLFEMLCLESQQAGLSWITILKKRENYRKVFYNFNPYKVSKFTQADVNNILKNNGIIRHKGKIEAIINNSKCYIDMENNSENFSDFIWKFVDNKPKVNNWLNIKDVPTKTEVSDALSAALKKRGFKFVGSTICYAFMQACGLVNDHIAGCFCYNIII